MHGVSPHLSCKPDQIKMRHYMNRRVTPPPKRVTSPTWGPPRQCKQALRWSLAFVPKVTVVKRFNCISLIIPLYEKFRQFDWLRAVVFPLNLKYLHVEITNLL